MTAEKWLMGNCEKTDWNRIEEGLNDSLWTNNVIKYMEQYANYKQIKNTSSNSDYAVALQEMDKAIKCLAIQVPSEVHKDISERWQRLNDALRHFA